MAPRKSSARKRKFQSARHEQPPQQRATVKFRFADWSTLDRPTWEVKHEVPVEIVTAYPDDSSEYLGHIIRQYRPAVFAKAKPECIHCHRPFTTLHMSPASFLGHEDCFVYTMVHPMCEKTECHVAVDHVMETIKAEADLHIYGQMSARPEGTQPMNGAFGAEASSSQSRSVDCVGNRTCGR
ncbi:hypothetical protein PtrV1_07318 [Pyrenophora tritici-repentis]|uniref:Uncharacterized protein n=1 Tax=Pyrenophora tritici-repentis TaxID=45151 RepID=A0A5M9L4Y8_9PLEO|nr:hypothetical protein PtrV1_07318 [Pyrenophora tritici-repentis]KAF7448379.1 hypothetical protein A1F99_077430 [Pyrenophora tritici-repentis]KAF7572095.1 hypothetical protein PtrM4_095950 [Pyrenophora tritici-repentis]KAI0582412.1 hypothetical protein Alg215_04152 [Pyrenophora tritici-repentis]KAI1517027.1 hypothetical protein Ptr86124_003964 [Pyrenophora tritici-repentis]